MVILLKLFVLCDFDHNNFAQVQGADSEICERTGQELQRKLIKNYNVPRILMNGSKMKFLSLAVMAAQLTDIPWEEYERMATFGGASEELR